MQAPVYQRVPGSHWDLGALGLAKDGWLVSQGMHNVPAFSVLGYNPYLTFCMGVKDQTQISGLCSKHVSDRAIPPPLSFNFFPTLRKYKYIKNELQYQLMIFFLINLLNLSYIPYPDLNFFLVKYSAIYFVCLAMRGKALSYKNRNPV